MQLCHQIIHHDLGRTYYKITTTEKIKAINNKIKQNKAQYNLDRQAAKISALSSGNVGKNEFLTSKDVLPDKDLLEKAATIKRFEYLPLDKESKAQTSIAKDQYKLFTDQMNINNNNRKGDTKKEDIEIDTVDHVYIGDEYNNLIDNIFKFRLRDGDLHLTKFDNQKFGLRNIVNNYLEKKEI